MIVSEKPLTVELINDKLKGIQIDFNDVEEALYEYELMQRDLEAHERRSYYLEGMDLEIPYSIVKIMNYRISSLSNSYVSDYGIFRSAEDYVVHTSWFKRLAYWARQEIHEDFYNTIIEGVRDSFDRMRSYE
jgi:hypothetical protein